MRNPFFSIIVVVFNASAYIQKCLDSIVVQDDFELIVIDGGSTDNTCSIVKKFDNHITHFVSEKDNGIYDAMNKGIDLAGGEYIYFLGADDYFHDAGVLKNAKEKILKNKPHLLLGDIIYNTGIVVKPRFDKTLLLHNSIHHQGTFYSKKLFNDFRYDSTLKLIADYELNLKIYLQSNLYTTDYFNDLVAVCGDNGASRVSKALFIKETNQIRKKYIKGIKGYFLNIAFSIKVKLISILRRG